MAHYLVTLVIETEPGQGSPAGWDWPELIDSPHGVSVIACAGIGDDPSDRTVTWLSERMVDIHEVMGRYLG